MPRSEWHDVSTDRWGKRDQRSLLRVEWRGGNCVRACVASILNVDIARVPDPTREFTTQDGRNWFARYNQRLRDEASVYLEELPKSLCPPKNPTQLWIAGISFPDHDADHVVVARGYFCVFDPLGEFEAQLPWNRVLDSYIVRPAKRLTPNLDPHSGGLGGGGMTARTETHMGSVAGDADADFERALPSQSDG